MKIKKMLCLLLCAICAVSAAACSAGAIDYELHYPWSERNSLFNERTEYTVTRKNGAGELIASGTTVMHTDEVDGYHALRIEQVFNFVGGTLPDTMSSYTIFNLDFSTFSTTKTLERNNPVVYEMGNNISFTMTEEDDFSYSASYRNFTFGGTDHTTGVSFTDKTGTRSLELAPLTYGTIDNELVYYFVRSMGKLGNDFSTTFNLVNLFDTFANNKDVLKVTPMRVAVQSTNVPIELDASLVSVAGGTTSFKAVDEDNPSTVSCLPVTLSVNSQQSGAAATLYYSAPISDTMLLLNDRRVLIKVITNELDLIGNVIYSNEYVLSGYSRNTPL